MKSIREITLVAVAFATALGSLTGPATAQDQEVAPIFQQVPAVLYETYQGVNNPGFNDYFEMLVEKYNRTGGTGWAIYRENAKTAYRITVLPNGLESLLEVQRARGASFQEFNDEQLPLWNAGWGTRHVAVYNTSPAMSVVPEGFTVDDIRALPYHRTSVLPEVGSGSGVQASAAGTFRARSRGGDRELRPHRMDWRNRNARPGRDGPCLGRESGSRRRSQHASTATSARVLSAGMVTPGRDHERISVAHRASRSDPRQPAILHAVAST